MNNNKIDKLVDSILDSYKEKTVIGKVDAPRQPSKEVVVELLDNILKILFPGYYEYKNLRGGYIRFYVGELLENIQYNLVKQLKLSFRAASDLSADEIEAKAAEITDAFLEKIPSIRETLETDVLATYDGDPAAYSYDEIIYSYPGIYAISVSRVAHELFILGAPLIPRMMTEHAHSLTGIDIHPGAQIGKYFCIDHGTGIVIGETTIIGEWVKIYQGVTLGGISTTAGQALKGVKRHPTIEDHVTIYANASILGGDTVIGEGSVIGGSIFVTESVAANTRVTAKTQELVFSQRKNG